ncbi:MAG: S9 family peptidase [Alphaproteobacteria bacterium]|nr:S9 family peptidase [Alphaproteobacteria bacterium]
MSASSKQIEKYGFWASNLSAEKVAGKALRFSGLETLNGDVYWSESRPDEAGRSVIVKRSANGDVQDIIAAPYSAASRVHEYGGGEFGLGDDVLVFVNAKDQDLYKVDLAGGAQPVRLTQMADMRFADIQVVEDYVVAVAEYHDPNGVANMPENLLIRVSLNADAVAEIEVIAQSKPHGGRDFYAYPRISPCRSKIIYTAWDLPHMPWQCAEVFMADINDNGIENAERLAGGGNEAVFAPIWHTDGGDHKGAFYYIGDGTGIGNLYDVRRGVADNLWPIEAECGHPNWVFGMRSYDVLDNGLIVMRIIEQGVFKLVVVEPWSKQVRYIETDFKDMNKITAFGNEIVMFATTDQDAEMLVRLNVDTGEYEVLRRSSDEGLAEADISVGQVFQYAVGDDDTAWAIYYPPMSGTYKAENGELPPVIVKAHGGPTSLAGRGFNLKYHYWTSRGFGLVDLDYRGSFGYGREYVQKLDCNWGITDVEDAVAAIAHLSDEGKVNKAQAFITGGSAGGFTVLMALATTNDFLAGTSYFGVADLGGLAKATHKFELKYMDELVGLPEGATADEAEAFFLSRSPLSMLDDYRSPTLFLQGLDDKVVPPEQSKAMYDVLKAKNVRTKLINFEGEGHGFKKAENNITSLKEELQFYQDLM